MNLSGKIRQVIGTGEAGRTDGPFPQAQFNRPQGVTLVGDMLYVADTENHLVRRVHLATQQVETIAGTGEQAGGGGTPPKGGGAGGGLGSALGLGGLGGGPEIPEGRGHAVVCVLRYLLGLA